MNKDSFEDPSQDESKRENGIGLDVEENEWTWNTDDGRLQLTT